MCLVLRPHGELPPLLRPTPVLLPPPQARRRLLVLRGSAPAASSFRTRGRCTSSPTSPWCVFLPGGPVQELAASSAVRATGGTVVSASLPASRRSSTLSSSTSPVALLHRRLLAGRALSGHELLHHRGRQLSSRSVDSGSHSLCHAHLLRPPTSAQANRH
jgi:hypothetical protein